MFETANEVKYFLQNRNEGKIACALGLTGHILAVLVCSIAWAEIQELRPLPASLQPRNENLHFSEVLASSSNNSEFQRHLSQI